MAVPMECELLVLVGEGAAGEPDPHHVVVEGGDLGPALPHLGADQFGMPAGREDGVGDVVEHDAVLAPQHHHGHGGAEHDRGRGPEALRLSVDGAERGLGPVRAAMSWQQLPLASRVPPKASARASAKVVLLRMGLNGAGLNDRPPRGGPSSKLVQGRPLLHG